jgi:hypothetical protein
MAYNYAAAFLPPDRLHRPCRDPWNEKPPISEEAVNLFEGPVIGFKPKIEIASNPVNIGKTATMLLDLRARWLGDFLTQVLALNPEIPRDVAIMWVNNFMPTTASELIDSLLSGGPEKLAFRLADAWETA